MVSLDDIKNLRIYKKKFLLPFNSDNKKKKSAIILLTPNYKSSMSLMTSPLTINRKYYESYYMEKSITRYIKAPDGSTEEGYYSEDPGEYIFEAKLDSKTRKDLPDEDFGLPKERRYPMPDEEHVLLAIKFFNHVEKEKEAELAKNIIRKVKEYDMADKVKVGDKNRFKPYWLKSGLAKSSVSESVVDNYNYLIDEANAYDYYFSDKIIEQIESDGEYQDIIQEATSSTDIERYSLIVVNKNGTVCVGYNNLRNELVFPGMNIVPGDKRTESQIVNDICEQYLGILPTDYEFLYDFEYFDGNNKESHKCISHTFMVKEFEGSLSNLDTRTYKFIKFIPIGGIMKFDNRSPEIKYFLSRNGVKYIKSNEIKYATAKLGTGIDVVFDGYERDIQSVKPYVTVQAFKEAFSKLEVDVPKYKIRITVSGEQNENEYMDERNLVIYTPKAFNSAIYDIDYKNYIKYVLELFVINVINPNVYDNLANPIALVVSGAIDDELSKEVKPSLIKRDKYATERVYKYILDKYGINKIKRIIKDNDPARVLTYVKEYIDSFDEAAEDLSIKYFNILNEEESSTTNNSDNVSLDDIKKFGTSLKRRIRSKSIYKLNKIMRDIQRGNIGTESREANSLEMLKSGSLADRVAVPDVSIPTAESYAYYKKHTDGKLVAFENMVYLFEDQVDTTLRRSMYKDRLRNNKEVLALYKKIKADLPFIKYAFVDLNRYNNRNIFYDLSYYIESFFRNATFINEKGKMNTARLNNIFVTLMNRLLVDERLNSLYTKKTIFIPVLDWRHNDSTRMWMYRFDINPISFIYDLISSNNTIALKRLFGNSDVVFFGGRNYFKINFSQVDFSKQKEVLRFTKLIKRLVELGFTGEDPDPEDDAEEDSPTGIAMDIVDKVEKAKNVEINDVSDFKDLNKKVSDIPFEDDEEHVIVKSAPPAAEAVKNRSKAAAIKATKVKQPSVNRAVNVTTEKDKKKAITKSIATAVNTATDSDNAMDNLDKDEEFKKMVEDLGNDSESNVKVDKTRASKMAQAQEEFKNKKVQGKSVKELLKINPNDVKLETTKLPVASINNDWQAISFVNFDKGYDPDADIIKMIDNMKNWSYPIVVKDINVQDNSTSEDIVDLWEITCEDFKGTKFTLRIDVPKFINGSNFLKLRGNEKVINIQSTLIPIIKTGLDTCQIIGLGGYNKIFVRRFGSRIGQSTAGAGKLIKALRKYQGNDIKVSYGNSTEICSKYELPIDYIDISGIIAKIETKARTYYFNQDELREKYKVDNSKGLPISIKKANGNSEEMIEYISAAQIRDTMIANIIAHELCTESPKFAEVYESINTLAKCTYSRATILASDIPVIVICAFLEGLVTTLKKANIQYSFVREIDKEIKYSTHQDYIKFSDGYLVYQLDYASSLLLNGLKECDTESYSIKEINKKQMYHDFLDNFGGTLKADGLWNSYDCMIDPITREILELYKLPTDYVSVLLYANHLLSDNKYVRHIDQSVRRWRRKELIAGYFYKAIANGYEEYANSIRHTRKNVKISVKQSAIIDLILSRDPSISDLSVNNAVNDVECTHTVSNKGLAGMNEERAYTISTRGYDDSMLNVLGMDTPFSGSVGINRQATIDPSITGARGIVTTIDGDTDKLSVAKTLTITEAMTPLGSTHDDPQRTLMTYVQTSKHTMRCENNDPMLITTGADEALPYMTSDIFAFKAKGAGEVIEMVDDKYMVIEYKNGTHDYINLAEEIKKNSDGGYSVPIKLKTELHVGSKVKENEILAYDPASFSKTLGESGNLAASLGTLAKVAIINTDEGFEDSAAITESFGEKLTTNVIMPIECTVDKGSNIFIYKKIGDYVMEGESLIVTQSDFEDDASNALMKSLSIDKDVISELGRNPVKSKYTGILTDVKIYRTCELDEMSESLRKFVSSYERNVKQTKSIYSKYGIDSSALPPVGKLDQIGKTKNLEDAVKIIFYIKYGDAMSVGDKIVFYSANKGIIKYIIPKDVEPYTAFRPNEHIDSFMSLSSISGRMTCSIPIFASVSKLMVELDRSIKDIAGIKYDESRL